MLFRVCVVTMVVLAIGRVFLGGIGLFSIHCFCRMMRQRFKNMKRSANKVNASQNLRPSKYRTIVSHFVDGMIKFYMVKISMIPAHWLRMLCYKYIFMMDISHNVVIYKGCRFRAPYKIHIGANTVIGDDCILDGREGLFIGENVNLSSDVRIWTGQHSVNAFDFGYVGAPVYIHDRAWVSSNAIILPGCQIERGAVIAAGAVLTKGVPEFSIAGGGTG